MKNILIIALILFSTSIYGKEIGSTKIWDSATHSAFTGLVEFKGKLYCCFREAALHVDRSGKDVGKIRILVSKNGKKWTSHALLTKEGVDLRDPQLLLTPDGKMMIMMGGSVYKDGEALGGCSHVSFSDTDGNNFSKPEPITINTPDYTHTWLWKIQWYDNIAYGAVYGQGKLQFVKSTNGINYDIISDLKIDGFPNETAIWFNENGGVKLIVRREKEDKNGYLGESVPPYTEWNWTPLQYRLGGPELIQLPNGEFIIGSRQYLENKEYRMTIFSLTADKKMKPIITLPSSGDCSYPGMIVKNNKLYVSYYSSHENKTAIYFSIIPLSEIEKKLKSI